MTDETRLTDKIGIVGLDGTDYGELETHQTTVDTDILKQGIELLDTLGWDQVDVVTVESGNDDNADYPLLVLRPPHESLFSGDQAGIAMTPRTEKGRNDE
jgi:hypothetical protein